VNRRTRDGSQCAWDIDTPQKKGGGKCFLPEFDPGVFSGHSRVEASINSMIVSGRIYRITCPL